MAEKCCNCPTIHNRCQTEDCPCHESGKPCKINCETQKLFANCLNRPITRCSCTVKASVSHQGLTRSPSHLLAIQREHTRCNSNICECYRLREPCTAICGCNKDGCSHSKTAQQLYTKSKEYKGVKKGCKCSGGKKVSKIYLN